MAISQRLNYFKGQFLRAKDFLMEQQYHIDSLCFHNKNFHTPGIATGLEVTQTASRRLAVSPGVAVNGAGRQIVLEAPVEVELTSAGKSGPVWYLTITHTEKATDPINETGVAGDTRITESPAVKCVDTRPADEYKELILAEVILNEDNTIQRIDLASRRYAGVNAGELAVKTLTFPDLKEPVRIERNTASGGLLVDAKFTGFVKGNVGIGTGQPQAKLVVNGGMHIGGDSDPGNQNLQVDGNGVFGGGLEVKGSDEISNFKVDAGGNIVMGAALSNLEIKGKLVLAGKDQNPICFTSKYIRLPSDPDNMAVICNDVSSDNNALVIEGNKTKDRKTGRVLIKGVLDVSDQFCLKGVSKFDLAEMTPVCPEDHLRTGEVVVIDCEKGLRVRRCTRAWDTAVYGIVSSFEQAAIIIGAPTDTQPGSEPDQLPIALIGRVAAWVSAEAGPVQPGDLLTTAATPGHLMRCNDRLEFAGAITAKALEPLVEGKGMILVMVSRQ